MKLGLLSESHGQVSKTKAALGLLRSHEVDKIIHCGDLETESVVIELHAFVRQYDIPVHAVLGNVDYPDNLYQTWSNHGKLEIMGRFGDLVVDDVRMAIIHGDNGLKLCHAIQCGAYDYVFTGHTHISDDRNYGAVRVINPGAVHRSKHPSVATLDIATKKLEFLPLHG